MNWREHTIVTDFSRLSRMHAPNLEIVLRLKRRTKAQKSWAWTGKPRLNWVFQVRTCLAQLRQGGSQRSFRGLAATSARNGGVVFETGLKLPPKHARSTP
jgi:hypothetical protein